VSLLQTLNELSKVPLFLIPARTYGSDASPETVADFAYSAARKVLAPLQVRSEIVQLLHAVRAERPRYVLEIGTNRGATLFMLTRVVAPDARLISVDLPGGPYGGGYPSWKAHFYRAFALPGQRIECVRANSHDPDTVARVRASLGEHRLDFLFIDGDHSYEGVKTDFGLYRPLVKQGGLIALHDIVPDPNCGVDRFWNEIKAGFDCKEFIGDPKQGWAGIGLVRNHD
jgi:predicted O-methyltransferase YrrM